MISVEDSQSSATYKCIGSTESHAGIIIPTLQIKIPMFCEA